MYVLHNNNNNKTISFEVCWLTQLTLLWSEVAKVQFRNTHIMQLCHILFTEYISLNYYSLRWDISSPISWLRTGRCSLWPLLSVFTVCSLPVNLQRLCRSQGFHAYWADEALRRAVCISVRRRRREGGGRREEEGGGRRKERGEVRREEGGCSYSPALAETVAHHPVCTAKRR